MVVFSLAQLALFPPSMDAVSLVFEKLCGCVLSGLTCITAFTWIYLFATFEIFLREETHYFKEFLYNQNYTENVFNNNTEALKTLYQSVPYDLETCNSQDHDYVMFGLILHSALFVNAILGFIYMLILMFCKKKTGCLSDFEHTQLEDQEI